MNLRLQNWNDAKSQQGTKHVHKVPLEESWPYNHSEEKHFSSPSPFIPLHWILYHFLQISLYHRAQEETSLKMIPPLELSKLLQSIKSIVSTVRAAERISLQRRAIFIEPLRWICFKSCHPGTVGFDSKCQNAVWLTLIKGCCRCELCDMWEHSLWIPWRLQNAGCSH